MVLNWVSKPLATEPNDFDDRKELYRMKRDEFRSNPEALIELAQWKAHNHNYEYKLLTGFVPSGLVGQVHGIRPYEKADTFFSEYDEHNDRSWILSQSDESFIIGNLASYDKRQYPAWLDIKNQPGVNTPEGQAFGHTLVVSRKRIFNIVDPEATAENCSLLIEMMKHFVSFWSTSGGKEKVISRVKKAVDDQNTKLEKKNEKLYRDILPQILNYFYESSEILTRLGPEDFVFAFHPWPESSIGHLHMHIFPRLEELRKFSTRKHDWKTISIKCVLAVEEELGPGGFTAAMENQRFVPFAKSEVSQVAEFWRLMELSLGAGKLGTFEAPTLPQFLTNNPIVNGYPWGSKSAYNSDAYTQAPNTGIVRSYDFTITRGVVAPDGYELSTLLINGQFPGPTINANWGDTIEVTVHNKITGPEEGTAIHWHGLQQQHSEWMDGVPAVSTCPITPGCSFTYRFKANPYGTTWYHSHYSSQYSGGLWGPLIIHGPKSLAYDIDLGPVALTDYYHRDYFSILADVVGSDLTKVRPASDNNLINGKMNFNCTGVTGVCNSNAGLSKFRFVSGKKHRLRLINTGSAAIQKFSIDNHKLTIIANDFIPVEPYETNVITLGVGQRTDIIVEATGHPKDIYWIRSKLSSGQCTEPSNQPNALAAIYYEKADRNGQPGAYSKAQVDTTDPCANDALNAAVPSHKIAVRKPATTINVEVNFKVNATGHLVWTIDGSAFRGDYNNPLLLLAKAGNTSYPYNPEWNVYNFGSNHSIRVVLNNKTPTSHPWHLHGHDMSILAIGSGSWDGTVVNPDNPPRRDTAILPANGYLVAQWDADNPGVWPFHCHIAWHVSGGLNMNLLERPADIKQLPIPSTSYQLCRDWAAYTGSHVVDQIDSGL